MKTEPKKQSGESEKLDHYFKQVKDSLEGFAAPCQRLIILHVSKGTNPREDMPNPDIAYGVGKLKKLFAGCEASFRNKVLFKYLVEILPSLEAEHDKAAEEQAATDELLALTEGKSAQEIKAMIEVLKTSEVLASA